MPRSRLTLLSLAALLCCLSLAGSARAATITGIADEDLDHWSDPTWAAFNATGVKQVRHIVRWDAAWVPWALQEAHDWVNAAQARNLEVVISFGVNWETSPPSPAIYWNAVKAFRKEFREVAYYTAWNEPNHSLIKAGVQLNPLGDPVRAADYWAYMNAACHEPGLPTCTVIAGDFSDDANIATYMDSYKAGLAAWGANPSTWAFHPYSTIASGDWTRLLAFMTRTEGKPVWFTEVGGYVCNPSGGGLVGGSYPAAEANQAQSIQNLRAVIDNWGPTKIPRTYYYAFSAPNGTQQPCVPGNLVFDTTLLGAGETPRPGFSVAFPGVLNPPAVSTGGATGIQMSQATLNAGIDPRGFHSDYRFEYGTTTAYGSYTAWTPAGFNPGAVPGSATIGGLQPGTTYHYRVVASNAAGTSYGADQTFTTPEFIRPSAVMDQNGNVQVYARDASGQLLQYIWNPGASKWQTFGLGGSIVGTPSAVISANGSSEQVYARDTSGQLLQYIWDPGASKWQIFGLGGSIVGNPSAVMDQNGNTRIYARDPSGQLVQYIWNPGASKWQIFGLGGSIDGNPSAVISANGSNERIYARDASGQLVQYIWDSGASKWQIFGLGGSIYGDSLAVRSPNGSNEQIFVRDASGQLVQYIWDPGASKWQIFGLGGSL
jgi:hypothetical protein